MTSSSSNHSGRLFRGKMDEFTNFARTFLVIVLSSYIISNTGSLITSVSAGDLFFDPAGLVLFPHVLLPDVDGCSEGAFSWRLPALLAFSTNSVVVCPTPTVVTFASVSVSDSEFSSAIGVSPSLASRDHR